MKDASTLIEKIPLLVLILIVLVFGALLTIALVKGREIKIGPLRIGSARDSGTENNDEDEPVTTTDFSDSGETPVIEGIDKFLNNVIHDESIRSKTVELIKGLRGLNAIQNEHFQNAISIDYSQFLNEVKDWAKSSVKLEGAENDNFLIKMYRGAKTSVFSTCVPDFIEGWAEDDFMKDLLKAHKDNTQCETTRVFIVNNKKDVKALEPLIRLQNEFGVRTLILIDKLNEVKDFTIIDGGEIIGESINTKRGKRLTTWYFEEENQKTIFMSDREIILNKAKSFESLI